MMIETQETIAGIDQEEITRPRLPAHLYAKSTPLSLVFIFYSICMFVLPAAAALYTWRSELELVYKIPAMAVLLFLSQQGLHLFGWVGHEGFHLSLFKNKFTNAYAGIFISSMIFAFMQIGASISHWNHHRYTNQELDPDVQIFTKFKHLWSRLLFGRLTANRIYMRNTFKMLNGQALEYNYKLPFSKEETKKLAALNIICALFWMAVYTAITVMNPEVGVICIIIPHIMLTFYSGIRSYLEHAGTGEGILSDTRSRIAPFFTFFYFGNNYHLEHHLYPMAPCYRLPAIHKHLRAIGFFHKGEVHIEKGVLKAYSFATGKYSYPDGRLKNSAFDPLLIDN